MPVLATAGQPAHLQPEHQPDAVEGDLGEQTLEAGAALDGLAALAQVVVDGDDPVARPAEGNCPVGQGVLSGGGLLVIEDLLRRRLADVDDGHAVEVPGPEFEATERFTHGRPPCGSWPRGAGRAVGRGVREVASASWPADGPTPAAGWPALVWSASGAGGRGALGSAGHEAPLV